MRGDELIEVRDKIDVFVNEKGADYKAYIDDITKEGYLLTNIPSHLGVLMPLKKGQKIKLAFYRPSGRFVTDIRVRDVKMGNINQAVFEVISKPVREQRRSFFRLEVSLKAGVYQYPEESETEEENKVLTEDVLIENAKTSNISISGVQLVTKKEYKYGDRFLLKIYTEWPRPAVPPLSVCGEVRRVNQNAADETYNIGFHFISNYGSASEFLNKYILEQQKKQIRQKRLIEGE